MLVCILFAQLARETAGAARTRCALCFVGGTNYKQTSGDQRREIAKSYPAVIVREGGRSSIPETSLIEPISRGVLDPRLRGDDEGVLHRYLHVIASAEAIHSFFLPRDGLLRFACNDGWIHFCDLATYVARGLPLTLSLHRNRGRREDRVLAAPAVSRAICANKNAHEHTGSAEAFRPSPRNGLRLITCSPR